MNRMPFLYRIERLILGPIFFFYYKPIIKGIDNLNEEGPLIIASNHIHLYDQCFTIVKRKKAVTFMAKKEYFDSIKTRWFFKGVGCIPVDRTKKDEESVSKALEVLNNKGVIGIFPEGTRNALKEDRVKILFDKYFHDIEYQPFLKKMMKSKQKLSQIYYLEQLLEKGIIELNDLKQNIFRANNYLKELLNDGIISTDDYYSSLLLDFKYGAVSMASKTGAKIIPIGISGTYTFRSKDLKVNIGDPIDISNMELGDANKLLFNEIKELIKDNEEV